jgi:hypothetical protein
LSQEKSYAQGFRFSPQISVSFFNNIVTERKTMLVASVSFFNELSTERKTMLMTSVSFFSDLSTERKTMLVDSHLDHGFQEDNALEGHHVKGHNSVMDSKRSSLDERIMLWKEHMSRSVIGVRRSDSKIPTEEITMSTTRSKSLEIEVMGDNAT